MSQVVQRSMQAVATGEAINMKSSTHDDGAERVLYDDEKKTLEPARAVRAITCGIYKVDRQTFKVIQSEKG